MSTDLLLILILAGATFVLIPSLVISTILLLNKFRQSEDEPRSKGAELK
jgi:hypothetical protein